MTRSRTWVCVAGALLPGAVVLSLAAALFGAGPRDFVPVWSDEIVYWNEAVTFAAAGFEGGYATVHEQPARAAFSRFGPHGPVFAVVQGSVAALAGWHAYSPFLFNLAIVTLAAFAWLRWSRTGPSMAALLLIATFWPLLLYLPTNMQEPVHFALALLFALAIDRARPAPAARGFWAGAALLLLVSSLVRPSWALMLIPLGWARARRDGLRGVTLLGAATLAAVAAAYLTFDFVASPDVQHNLRRLANAWSESPVTAFTALAANVATNATGFVEPRDSRVTEMVFRLFLVALIVVLAARWFVASPADVAANIRLEAALLTIVPITILVVGFGQVESWRDFRVLAPHVLVALLLITGLRWERWLWAGTLLLLPFYNQTFVEFHEARFTSDRAAIARMDAAAREMMPFVPGAPPWSNTLLVHAELLQYPLIAVPPGVGISWVVDWSNVPDPVRSGYLILRPADLTQLEGRVTLSRVAETPLGTLYRNLGNR